MGRLVRLLFNVILAAAAAGSVIPFTAQANDDVAQVQTMVRESKFGVWRGLAEYFLKMGPEFSKNVLALKPGELWVDLGHGNGIALREYLVLTNEEFHESYRNRDLSDPAREYLSKIQLPPVDQRANVFGIGFHAPESKGNEQLFARVEALSPPPQPWWNLRRGPKVTPRYQEITGKFFLDIPQKQIREILGQAKLVTEFYGILNYETNFLQAFSLVLNSLPKDAVLTTNFMTHALKFGNADGKIPKSQMGWPDFDFMNAERTRWFKSIAGAELVAEYHSYDELITWRRTEGLVNWNPIVQMSTKFVAENNPPERVFHSPQTCDPQLKSR